MGDRVTAWLVLSALILVAIILAEVRFGAIPTEQVLEYPDKSPTLPVFQPPSPYSLAAIGTFSETLERPLFFESRKPSEAESNGTSNATEQAVRTGADELRILGIVFLEEEQFVLVENKQTRQPMRARKGDELDGWALAEIRPESIVLSNERQIREVQLWRFEQPPQPVKRRISRTARANPAQRTKGSRDAVAQKPRARPALGHRPETNTADK